MTLTEGTASGAALALQLACAPMKLLPPLTSTLLMIAACGDSGTTTTTTETGVTSTGEPGSTGEPTTGLDGTGTSGDGSTGSTGEPEPFLEGAPTPNVAPADQEVDVLGTPGLRYWFAVDPAEVERMNEANEVPPDIYVPGDEPTTHANHLFVSTPGERPQVADYGKVELRVVGQSTFRPWTPKSIPSLKADTDEFTDGLTVGGVEHLRFNNGLVGTIFRERLALQVYDKLGYPAPRATHAWVGSNIWGPDIQVPYTLVEVYKRDFCEARAEALGGGCNNIWEFVGDLGFNLLADPTTCQLKECDNTRALAFEAAVVATPQAPGYKAALADWVEWDAFHRFQCLSWLLWTGDDALHNSNNVVLLERMDGRFQYLPYSVDISAGQEWYPDTPLYGQNQLALGCQADPACWADTIATCEDVVADFVALDPPALVDALHAELDGEGMLRAGDEARYQQIRDWYKQRADTALLDLDNFRDAPCPPDTVKCNGACVGFQECVLACEPGSVQCGPDCAPEGECFTCEWPFERCADDSCKPQGLC